MKKGIVSILTLLLMSSTCLWAQEKDDVVIEYHVDDDKQFNQVIDFGTYIPIVSIKYELAISQKRSLGAFLKVMPFEWPVNFEVQGVLFQPFFRFYFRQKVLNNGYFQLKGIFGYTEYEDDGYGDFGGGFAFGVQKFIGKRLKGTIDMFFGSSFFYSPDAEDFETMSIHNLPDYWMFDFGLRFGFGFGR